MKLAGSIVAVLLAAVNAASGEPEWPFPARTADFVAKCRAERAWCAAAIEFMHSRDSVMSAIRTHYCVPVEQGADARIDPILAFVARHSGAGDETRESLLAASKVLWPCRGTRYVDPLPCGKTPDPALQNRGCDGPPAPAR